VQEPHTAPVQEPNQISFQKSVSTTMHYDLYQNCHILL
jgi:hypothetical protein